ncbi:glycosyltransferase family 1 protein [Corallococcus sp. AB011P]|uniref:glycosyltransferase family 4 protein n=1 Tax=unclassified Corallococcus TaxID=2685029 RepID=UPI000EA0BE8B|nr:MULTISPECIES: glycosyltransferase family 4 protein [unclassified Corallococcus]RKG57681.1 glycosyltransferase family 1 protein [Corallococcus sp. AB011P]RKH90352.1 glycosyltransferase family 1 protein [Corallococcus sp. AB045]
MKGLRIALLISMAPRKQGSLEDWIHAFCWEAARRGHQVDVWLHQPMLPSFVTELKASGARVDDLGEFERSGLVSMTRRLAGHDVIHLNFLAPRSSIAMAAYAAWPSQVLYTAHSDLIDKAENVVRRSLRWVVNQATMVRVHSLAGVSEHVRVKEGRRFGLHPHRSRTIFNGVDTRRFHPRARSRPEGKVELITIANLVESKGVHHLLGALGRLRSPRGRLRVVGDGPAQQSLRVLAVQLGLQHQTEFLGLRSDVQDLLGTSDICIQPSLVEAFGLTVAEAMACGCAVVASRVGGIPELIHHGRTGLLVEPGDEAGFAAALECLLDDPVSRYQLGAAARQRACEAFELSSAVRRHVDWCEDAAGYVSRARVRRTPASFLPKAYLMHPETAG